MIGYLARLFRSDKWLFLVITLFFVLTIISNLIRLQTTPFCIWDMYSKPIPPREQYAFFEIRYNDSKLFAFRHTWNEPGKTFAFDPLQFYFHVKDNHDISPLQEYLESYWTIKHPYFKGRLQALNITSAALQAFPGWYKRYISQHIDEPVKNIYIIKQTVHFGASGDLSLISSDTLLTIH